MRFDTIRQISGRAAAVVVATGVVAVLVPGSGGAAAAREQEQGVRAPVVSPTPQQETVTDTFRMPERAVVVQDAGSDPQAVKAAVAALRAAGVRRVETAGSARPGAYPVYVDMASPSRVAPGAEGPAGLAPGGYVLAVTGRGAVLDGVDAAGTYYAAESLRQVFKTGGGREITGAVVRDWPDFATRGGQESFYGAKWSYEDELREIEFLGAHKQNAFLYHPRIGDPHNAGAQWREPYEGDRLAELTTIVEEARARHIRFIYRLGPEAPTAPGHGICHTSEDDLAKVLARFRQLYDIGVRDLSLGWDDVGNRFDCAADTAKFGSDASPKAAAQAYVTNYVYDHFVKTHPGTRLITIPTEYWGATASAYKKRYDALVERDTSVYWTGPAVVSPAITNTQAVAAKAAYGNRNMLIFDNYPVNDYAPNRLHLGPLTDRDPALAGTVEGLTTNQMNQAAPSLIALFTSADFTWNSGAYDPEDSWDRALRELGGAAYPALKVFAENSRSGPLTSTKDAARLRGLTAALWTAWDEKGDVSGPAAQLDAYFGEMERAPEILRARMHDDAFVTEAGPWLNKLTAYGKAGDAAVRLLLAVARGESTDALADEVRAQRAAAAVLPQQLTGGAMDGFLSRALAAASTS
ncbi:beta-N-acetylhexosaminidase family protein [Streptomyces sp. NBC_01320]|uniref:beta-N-acetylhexosaminidase family protein n=1 Tax=Streptomyces sp. NBC_01320 TaxID=2903824 RepID=UPI002E14B63F|nr:beta-N-acetylglucosaminidase domain-containing protein [Streptomyces sp. NBC_01320]